jgi:tetratricopeptide (TPR) repeat protein
LGIARRATDYGEIISMKNLAAKEKKGWTNVQVYTAIGVVLVVGLLVGYLMHSSGTSSEESSTASTTSATLPPSALNGSSQQVVDAQPKPLLARLETNPKDVAALTELGNIYFDISRWPDAIGYYTRSLNEAPKNPDVRTDLGISYYYTGDADRALKEFDQALKDDPKHVQTLFNVGVVKLGGKNDPKGAIEAWESVLKIDPQYRDRAKLETMLAEARAKVK